MPWQKMVVGYSWRAQDDIAVKMAHIISLSSALPRIVPAPNGILGGGRSHRDTRSPQWRGRRTHLRANATIPKLGPE